MRGVALVSQEEQLVGGLLLWQGHLAVAEMLLRLEREVRLLLHCRVIFFFLGRKLGVDREEFAHFLDRVLVAAQLAPLVVPFHHFLQVFLALVVSNSVTYLFLGEYAILASDFLDVLFYLEVDGDFALAPLGSQVQWI